MNDRDVESMLKASRASKPRHELSADFTKKVLAGIAQPPKKTREWWARYLHISSVRIVPKPLMIAVGVAFLFASGGVVYAAANWPNISALFAGETRLPSGNRIVAIDTENCLTYANLDGSAQPDGKNTVYYEVKKDSSLTNQQVVGMVQAVCEENVANNVLTGLINTHFPSPPKGQARPGDPIVTSGVGFVIRDITATSMTLGADPKWFDDTSMAAMSADITYHRISPDVIVYDRGNRIAYADLRPGDSVRVVVHDEHPLGSEVDPNDPNHWDNPERIIIEAIIRTPTPAYPPSAFYRQLGTDFVRAEPCDSSSSGFCRAYEFTQDDFKKGVRAGEDSL